MRLLVVGFLVGCKAGNFVTVTVEGLPCDTVSLRVDVSIEGEGASSTVTFDDAGQLDDGTSSFALDMGNRKDGTLDVQVTATPGRGASVSTIGSTMLPATSLEVTLPGAGCPMSGVDADFSCWGDFAPSNFDPCVAGFPDPVDFVAGSINTDDGEPYLFDATHPVYLRHVFNINLLDNETLTVTGSRPLLIVVDDSVQIDGNIIFESSTSSPDCKNVTDPMHPLNKDAAGGGGGGFGTHGGDGGNSDGNGDKGVGGGSSITPSLVPLRTGCVGGAGASASTANGGAVGAVAGGIEISAMKAVSVRADGLIELNGGPGSGGEQSTDGTFFAGGGGGSSGGAILLEAPQVAIDGHVCAVGGGGGSGGSQAGTGGAGQISPKCTQGAAGGVGAPGISNHGGGGNGGGAGAPDNGQDGSAAIGSGGGGGAAGQIRFHSMMAPVVSPMAAVVPAPTP